MLKPLFIVFLLLLISSPFQHVLAQENLEHWRQDANTKKTWMSKALKDSLGRPSGDSIVYYRVQLGCKQYNLYPVFQFNRFSNLVLSPEPKEKVFEKNPGQKIIPHIPFLQFHGNIAYAFDYRSRIDTPFAVNNFQQHSEQIYADALIKNEYPFHILLSARQSNSALFPNYTDVNVQFNHPLFINKIKEQMLNAASKRLQLLDSVGHFENELRRKEKEYANLKAWLGNPARAQEIVQEREMAYENYFKKFPTASSSFAPSGNAFGTNLLSRAPEAADLLSNAAFKKISLDWKLLNKDSLTAKRIPTTFDKDSLAAIAQRPTATEKQIQLRRKRLDTLLLETGRLQQQTDSLKRTAKSDLYDFIARVKSAHSLKELKALEKEGGDSVSGFNKKLMALTQFGVGRSSLNYSELTVNNISLTGLNAEYNPSYYVAFAVGSVDYLFRDFMIKPANMPKQNLVLGRFGWGEKENRIFIVTAYSGTKNQFGGTVSSGSPGTPIIHPSRVFGYSFQTIYKLTKNVDASLEVAKSSSPYANKGAGNSFAFDDHSNEAWSAKVNIQLPNQNSYINLSYRKTGANFQSFSLYNSGSDQVDWLIKWKQYFFSNSLCLTAEVRRNNFSNPLIPFNYSSAFVFKSLQAVYRKRKYPVVSLGYMPSTQLVKSAAGYFSENIYYALNANAFYSYQLFHATMNTNLMYGRFFNKGTDSSFVYYNAKNLLLSHYIYGRKWNTEASAGHTKQPGLDYWTWQQKLTVQIGRYFSLGAGITDHYIPLARRSLTGGQATVNLQVKELGTLRVQVEKDYVPDGNAGLLPNNWGRVSWFKNF